MYMSYTKKYLNAWCSNFSNHKTQPKENQQHIPVSATHSRPPKWLTLPQAKASISFLVGICPEARDCLSLELQMPDSGLDEWWDSLSSPLSLPDSLPLPKTRTTNGTFNRL